MPGGESIGRRFVRLPEGKRSLPSGRGYDRVRESAIWCWGTRVRAYERTFPGPVSSRVHGESLVVRPLSAAAIVIVPLLYCLRSIA